MQHAIIPGAISIGCVFLPKSENTLFEASRIFAAGAASTSLCLISWKIFQASLLLISPGLSFSIGLSIYGFGKIGK